MGDVRRAVCVCVCDRLKRLERPLSAAVFVFLSGRRGQRRKFCRVRGTDNGS